MRLKIQWPLVLFSLITGIGGALFIMPAIPLLLAGQVVRGALAADVVAMVLLVVGGCCSIFHLTQLQNTMNVIKQLFSFSPISLEMLLVGLTFIAMLITAVMTGVGAVGMGLRVVAGIGIVLSLLLGFFCGHGYVMPGRPEWDTNLLPFAYLGTDLACGAMAFTVFQLIAGAPAAELAALKPWYLLVAVVCAVSCLAYAVRVRPAVNSVDEIGIEVSADIDRSAEESRVVRARLIYVGGLIVCGVCLVIIAGLLLFAAKPVSVFAIFGVVGCIAALLAGLSVRTLMWEVGRCYLPLFDLSEVGITV